MYSVHTIKLSKYSQYPRTVLVYKYKRLHTYFVQYYLFPSICSLKMKLLMETNLVHESGEMCARKGAFIQEHPLVEPRRRCATATHSIPFWLVPKRSENLLQHIFISLWLIDCFQWNVTRIFNSQQRWMASILSQYITSDLRSMNPKFGKWRKESTRFSCNDVHRGTWTDIATVYFVI